MTQTQWLAKQYRCTEAEAEGIQRVAQVVQQLAHDESFFRGFHALAVSQFNASVARLRTAPPEQREGILAKAYAERELPQSLLKFAKVVLDQQERFQAGEMAEVMPWQQPVAEW